MSTESSIIQSLLDRLRAGDATAIRQLTELAYERLRRLVAKLMNQSFPAAGVTHDVDSVLNTTYLRLHNALTKMAAEAKTPPTPADFFRFAAFKVRQVLFDLVRKDGHLPEHFGSDDSTSGGGGGFTPPDRDKGVDKSAQWRELFTRAERLPDDQREVFEMYILLGLSQADVATALGKEPKQVSRLWLKSAATLGPYLPDPS